MKFDLYEKVVSKKTGLPMTGTILGVMHPSLMGAQYYFRTVEECKEGFPAWTELYPEWTKKMIYTILFDTPSRTMSFEEFLEQNDEGVTKFDYHEKVPIRYCAAYPEDDLEPLHSEERTETSEINSCS